MYESKMSQHEELLERFLQQWDRKMQKGLVAPILVSDRRLIEAYTDWLVTNYTITAKVPVTRKVVVT